MDDLFVKHILESKYSHSSSVSSGRLAQDQTPTPPAQDCSQLEGQNLDVSTSTKHLQSWAWEPAGPQHASLHMEFGDGSVHIVTLHPTTCIQLQWNGPPDTVHVKIDSGLSFFYESSKIDNHFCWILRQYADVTPRDRNHDHSPEPEYQPMCFPRRLEICAIHVHEFITCFLGHTVPCFLSCGCYPLVAGKGWQTWNQINAESSGSREGWCSTRIWQTSATVCAAAESCTSRLLAMVALPTRAAGRYCGQKARQVSCIRNLVEEKFEGPPQGFWWNADMCMNDCVGGLVAVYTHLYRGTLQEAHNGLMRCVAAFCRGIERLPDGIRPIFPGGGESSKRAMQHMITALWNSFFLCITEFEDSLILGPITECVGTLAGMDVLLQGPILLQGYLTVSKEPCGRTLSMKGAWVVLRPWSVAVYESPEQMTMSRARVLISTSNIWRVSTAAEADTRIEVRTLDFSWYAFSIPTRVAPEPESNQDLLQHAFADLEVWRYAFTLASQRIESLASWDQGVGSIEKSLTTLTRPQQMTMSTVLGQSGSDSAAV